MEKDEYTPSVPQALSPMPVARSTVTVGSTTLIKIDGGYGEGGGQVLRSTTALAILTRLPIVINDIRRNRDKPGLRPQHLTGVNFVRDLSSARLEGGSVGSTKIVFVPNEVKGGVFEADTGTAGSIGLLIQISLPVMIFAPTDATVTFKGGTNAIMAPPIDFLQFVFKPISEKFGVRFDIDMKLRGFYPKGGGQVILRTRPVKQLNSMVLIKRGIITRIQISAFCCGSVPDHVPKRMASAVEKKLRTIDDLKGVEIVSSAVKEGKDKAFGDGTAIIIYATTDTGCILSGSAIGERGKSSEAVGDEAALMLIQNIKEGGCVDEHMQDQLIIFMALANGMSRVRIGKMSMHTHTNIHFCAMMTGAVFRSIPDEDGTTIIECDGVGYVNPKLK